MKVCQVTCSSTSSRAPKSDPALPCGPVRGRYDSALLFIIHRQWTHPKRNAHARDTRTNLAKSTPKPRQRDAPTGCWTAARPSTGHSQLAR
jgi:hypothetical protein